jgi:hypothetical protein
MIDRAAVGRGALVALVVTVPAGFAERAVAEGSKGLVFLIILVGFGAGLVYLAIGIVAHVATGDSIGIGALVFTGLLAMCCGALGAELGHRWHARRASTREDGRP